MVSNGQMLLDGEVKVNEVKGSHAVEWGRMVECRLIKSISRMLLNGGKEIDWWFGGEWSDGVK
jgi:hypothetical protein